MVCAGSEVCVCIDFVYISVVVVTPSVRTATIRMEVTEDAERSERGNVKRTSGTSRRGLVRPTKRAVTGHR